ncbi:hypothetical protein [uncultured Nostoc sp.]|uniref:hypothetical protein n=1 Tax=uncultured Nostoc sp. TaxID=340711 RepID=UPI0035C9ED0E
MSTTGYAYALVEESNIISVNSTIMRYYASKRYLSQRSQKGLEKEGWKITHDPLPVSFELGDMYI